MINTPRGWGRAAMGLKKPNSRRSASRCYGSCLSKVPSTVRVARTPWSQCTERMETGIFHSLTTSRLPAASWHRPARFLAAYPGDMSPTFVHTQGTVGMSLQIPLQPSLLSLGPVMYHWPHCLLLVPGFEQRPWATFGCSSQPCSNHNSGQLSKTALSWMCIYIYLWILYTYGESPFGRRSIFGILPGLCVEGGVLRAHDLASSGSAEAEPTPTFLSQDHRVGINCIGFM